MNNLPESRTVIGYRTLGQIEEEPHKLRINRIVEPLPIETVRNSRILIIYFHEFVMHTSHILMPSTHRNHTSPVSHISIAATLSLSAYSHPIQTTSRASQLTQPSHPPHRVPRQHHRQINNDHMATHNTQAKRPISKIERNRIILQVNMNGIKKKLQELKLLLQNTHAYIITIQETKLTLKQKLPKYITSPRVHRQVALYRGWAHHTRQTQHNIHYNRRTFDHYYT